MIWLIFAILILLLLYRPARRAVGLLMVILGTLACFTFVGAIIGIPTIIIGGLAIFE
jgi:hypothetical protein